VSAEEHLLQLAENIPQVVWITDPALRTMWYVSPAYEKVWGRSCASLYQNPKEWLEAIHEDDRARARAAMADILTTGRFDLTYRIRRPDGSVRWVLDRGTVVRGAGGEPERFVGIADDITDRVASDEQLREAKNLAEAADHAKSAFLAAMSHELRTPLTAIIGFSELMQDGTGGPLTDRQVKYVDNILSSGRALLDLIDQVLDIARVEAGRLTLTLTPVEIGHLIDDVAMLVRPLAAKKSIRLQVALSANLPKITADAPKIKQVVFGLLANGVRHGPEGGLLRMQAIHRAEHDGIAGDWIEVTVQDDGPGIPKDQRERLLNDFSLAEAGGPGPRSGTGVSLALARKLVELHGGKLWLDGDNGDGTAVRFLLPQTARPAGARTSPNEPMHVPEGADPGTPVVLVVEDDPQASDLLAHYIEAAGYNVARAYTAAQGFAMAEEMRPFAITLDPALPDGDGLDLLIRMRSHASLARIPVVVISVSPPRGDVASLGANAWLLKPVNRSELLGVLQRQPGGGSAPLHRRERA
jgi:PAS domain S-box-containing protein